MLPHIHFHCVHYSSVARYEAGQHVWTQSLTNNTHYQDIPSVMRKVLCNAMRWRSLPCADCLVDMCRQRQHPPLKGLPGPLPGRAQGSGSRTARRPVSSTRAPAAAGTCGRASRAAPRSAPLPAAAPATTWVMQKSSVQRPAALAYLVSALLIKQQRQHPQRQL